LGLDWKKYVEMDARYLRPSEVDSLLGDNTKARKILNWKPRMGFKELIHMMVHSDLNLAWKEKRIADHKKKDEKATKTYMDRIRISVPEAKV